MTWFKQWQALAVRIDGLICTVNFFISLFKVSNSNDLNIAIESIYSELLAINSEIIEIGKAFADELSEKSYKALYNYIKQYCNKELDNSKFDIQRIVPLVIFRHELEYLIITSKNDTIPKFDMDITDSGINLNTELEKIERIIIKKALQKTNGSKVKAAELLNVSFDSLRYRIEKLGVE